MTDPSELQEPANLRFLRILVTVLTAVMIGGLVIVIGLLVTRLRQPAVGFPDSISLPDGTKAQSFTVGRGWFAVVTDDDRILILDQDSGGVRQIITLD
jgi:hypothetical protein